jgi:nucleoside-diphosphate-sugar epimerase
LAALVPGFRWRLAATEEMPNTVSHVPWDRGALDVTRLAADAGWTPRFAMAQAAADYLAWDAEDTAAARE